MTITCPICRTGELKVMTIGDKNFITCQHGHRFILEGDMMRDFQNSVKDWLNRCFGPEIGQNKIERNRRFIEESVELVQSLGMSKEDILQLVDYVYSRPVGQPIQELGGTMVTLAALANAHGMNMESCGEIELGRCEENILNIRKKHFEKKI